MERNDTLPLISVIVPVYKVEPYLRKCVDSILAQTYTRLEVILVDDGSPDNCPAICDEYASQDSRVRVIHKPNGGLSSARNAGLDIAAGEYIGFVDSDDWIAPGMYEKLYEALRNAEADMAVCGVIPIDESGKELSAYAGAELKAGTHSVSEILGELARMDCNWYLSTAWNKLYRKELFSKLRYPIGKINEDSFVIHRLLGMCECVEILQGKYYYYLQRGSSITGSGQTAKKLDRLWAFYDRWIFFNERNYKAYAAITRRKIYMALYTYLDEVPGCHKESEFCSIAKAYRKTGFAPYDIKLFVKWLYTVIKGALHR